VNIIVKAPHIELTDSIRSHVEQKAGKLPRYFDNVKSIEVILDKEADKKVVEIIVTASHRNTFVASHKDEDLYAAVDQCLHKIAEQLRRHKDKVRDHQGPPHSQLAG